MLRKLILFFLLLQLNTQLQSGLSVPVLKINNFPEVKFISQSIKSFTAPVDSSFSISSLAKDESIKCTHSQLLAIEFTAKCEDKYGELLRITFQDLERGGREILFQKKLKETEEVKFYLPQETVKEAKTAVLIVCKGRGMFFKKIEVKD